MKRLLPALLCATALVATSLPAQAGGGWYHGKSHGYHHYKYPHYKHGGFKAHRHKHFKRHHAFRHHRHHYRHRHKHRGDFGDEILLGAGIIGGSIIVGSILSQPRYAPPPPPTTYYYTPPPAPTCVQDQVYRYLPDGSIQWGTRTRCY